MSSLRFTAAHSSRITKKTRTASSRSPLKKPSKPARTSSPRQEPGNQFAERLEETGLWSGSWDEDDDVPGSVLEAIRYALETQFTPLPEDLRLGLGRDTIAEILNYRKFLPPVVPAHHIHSLLPNLTRTQRELNRLTLQGKLRRIELDSRQDWEGFITAEDYENTVNSSKLSEDSRIAFLKWLSTYPGVNRISASDFPPETIRDLLHNGFIIFENAPRHAFLSGEGSSIQSLTATAELRRTGLNYRPAGPEKSLLGTLTSVSSVSANDNEDRTVVSSGYALSVPRLGVLLKLIESSQSHLVSILMQVPFKETTEQLMRERWDGGVSKSKKSSEKLEGRTKKWKDFYGLSFSSVLGGLRGSGLVEGFSTPVGRGVRLVNRKR